MSRYRKEFTSIEELFEKENKRAKREQEEYDKLVKRIVNSIATRSSRGGDSDEKMFEYHFTGLSFPGYHDKRCIEYVLQELEKRDFMAEFLEESRNFYITWEHYVPEYKRRVIQEKTGIVIDKMGRFVRNLNDDESELKQLEAQEQARKIMEMQKRRLEDSQFQSLQKHGVYDQSSLNSLRNLYSSSSSTSDATSKRIRKT